MLEVLKFLNKMITQITFKLITCFTSKEFKSAPLTDQLSSEMEKAPEWLSKSFLQEALIRFKNDETIEVLNFDVGGATLVDHFASTMVKSRIEYKSADSELEVKSVVIKVKPMGDGFIVRNVSSGPLFDNEIRMYTQTLPAMRQLFERSGMEFKMVPRYFGNDLKSELVTNLW